MKFKKLILLERRRQTNPPPVFQIPDDAFPNTSTQEPASTETTSTQEPASTETTSTQEPASTETTNPPFSVPDEVFPGGTTTRGFGSLEIAQYFKELMDEIGTSDVANYIKDQIQAAKDFKAQSAELNRYADALRDDPVAGTKKILVDAGQATFDKIKQNAENLRTGKAGTGFLSNYIAKTEGQLAGAKIPKSPMRNIGEPSPLRQRVNTKDFYK